MPFYAVAIGREPGIFSTWDECKKQVDKCIGARYKKFTTEEEAVEFMEKHDGKSVATTGFVTSTTEKLIKEMQKSLAQAQSDVAKLSAVASTQTEDFESLKKNLTSTQKSLAKLCEGGDNSKASAEDGKNSNAKKRKLDDDDDDDDDDDSDSDN